MCCFSGPVSNVARTRIFARWLPNANPARQALAYQMEFSAQADVAMILPIPVAPGTAEDAVKFLDLEKEPNFFDRLEELFPARRLLLAMPPPAAAGEAVPKKLEVVKVGSFEASFVPSQADFSRLDERFRLDPTVWKQLPTYGTWGFAVFKLRKDSTTVHPMGFSFPNSQPAKGLFFPTVHIHDGKVHQKEEFHHTLYCQVPKGSRTPLNWTESSLLPSSLGRLKDADLLDRSEHVYRRNLNGLLPNTDTYA
jgi:hypothetical protein